MSDAQNAGFGQFIPGFDFLQNLTKNAANASPQIPHLMQWIAPTLDVEELDKRISELKTVHFWLEQNAKALGATVQALEVQKMTLATLKGMNFNLGEMAHTFKKKAEEALYAGVQEVSEKAAATPTPPTPAAQAEAAQAQAHKLAQKVRAATTPQPPAADAAAPLPSLIDPLQLWNALTQQFQTIATHAMKDVSTHAATPAAPAADAAKPPQAGAQAAVKARAKPAAKPTVPVAAKPSAKKAPKTAAKN